MWLHYCVFTINTYEDPDTIRRLFERGLAYVGTDYLSFPLWDKYIEYEYQQNKWSNLAMIYTRILENPNQQLDRYYNSFRELVANRPLSELRTTEELEAAARANVEFKDQHSSGVWVDVANLEFIEGNKPIVYSSRNGHANYPHPGEFLQGSANHPLFFYNCADTYCLFSVFLIMAFGKGNTSQSQPTQSGSESTHISETQNNIVVIYFLVLIEHEFWKNICFLFF